MVIIVYFTNQIAKLSITGFRTAEILCPISGKLIPNYHHLNTVTRKLLSIYLTMQESMKHCKLFYTNILYAFCVADLPVIVFLNSR